MKLKPLAIVVALVAPATALDAHACKCVGQSSYDAIFEGRVVGMSKATDQASSLTAVEFSVSRSITGTVTQRATVYTPVPVLMCGVRFELGQTYTVRAVLVGSRLETLDCYGTAKQ